MTETEIDAGVDLPLPSARRPTNEAEGAMPWLDEFMSADTAEIPRSSRSADPERRTETGETQKPLSI
jgi:hypothetical protein